MLMKKTFLFFLAAACCGNLLAQTPDTARLSQYLETLSQNNRYMGSVALMKDGKVMYQKAVGLANIGPSAPNTPQTLFRIGSISKTFTAAMIVKAAEEGKLKLSDPLKKYFPTLKVVGEATIAQTLRHRSGIHNFTADTGYLSWHTSPQTEAQLLARIEKGGRDFAADSTFSYSNSGYALLGFVLEKVYKKPYAGVLEDKIAKPLGLKHTGIYPTGHNQNASYRWEGKWVPEAVTDLSVPIGAGNILSTPADLTRFFDGLFSGKIVSAASLEEMKTMQDGYGYGLGTFPFNKEKGYGHTGGIDGYHSMAGYFPQSKIAFATVSNGLNYTQNDIAIALLQTAHGQAITIPEFATKAAADLPKGYPGVYGNGMLPFKITVTQSGDVLTMQATGQGAFPLEKVSGEQYQFTPAGIQVEFFPAENAFMMKQGGGTFRFEKEAAKDN